MDLGSAGECREKISFANEIRAAKWFGNRGYENRETRACFRSRYGSNRRTKSGNGIRDSLENACTAMLAFRGGQIVRSLHPRESYAEQERQYARPADASRHGIHSSYYKILRASLRSLVRQRQL